MAEYAEKGLKSAADAVRLALDYFSLPQREFIDRWLPHKRQDLHQQTTPESWRRIVDSLGNRTQRDTVTDDLKATNILLLAGPGSGKTRVLVHRIAYLIRAKRETPNSILALAYNRHAASQIRQRLHDLIGADAAPVAVLTYHALAMRLLGRTFHHAADQTDGEVNNLFEEILKEAIALLEGRTTVPEEADEIRERLLAGFRWILVDEYQNIKETEYALIAALAGRTKNDPDQKLHLFAVGDDDQNIYTFSGSSTRYIRRFEQDYHAKSTYMVENYRSTKHIIDAANTIIAPARERMKSNHPVQVNQSRRNLHPGGEWQRTDPIGQGKVQILPAGDNPYHQAQLFMTEFLRLSDLDPYWDWSTCAVIARNWSYLDPVRTLCEYLGIPAQLSREEFTATWQLWETQALIAWLREHQDLIDTSAILTWLDTQPPTTWNLLLTEAVENYALDTADQPLPPSHFVEWLAEWSRDNRRRQHGLLLTSAHWAKGLEFDHVAVLDGGWERHSRNEDPDAPRRLYYVAMTRDKKTLTFVRMGHSNPYLDPLEHHDSVMFRPSPEHLPTAPTGLTRRYSRLTLRDVDLSYPARQNPRTAQRIAKAVEGLRPGDPLTVQTDWAEVDPEFRTGS